jgi:NAD(P)H-dependent FMN reductase
VRVVVYGGLSPHSFIETILWYVEQWFDEAGEVVGVIGYVACWSTIRDRKK